MKKGITGGHYKKVRKDKRLTICLTEGELALIRERARMAGVSAADYAAQICCGRRADGRKKPVVQAPVKTEGYVDKENEKTVLLDEMNIILRVPKDASRLTVHTAILQEDGTVLNVRQSFSASEILECRRSFLDNIEFGDDYDAAFALTELGLQMTEDTEKAECSEEDPT